MAPGARKLKSKTIPNKSQQSVIDHTTKDASSNSTPRRSIRRIFDRTNVAANEALVRTEMQNGSFERGETTTTNHTNESDNMPQNSEIPASQSPDVQPHPENIEDPTSEENEIIDVPAVSKKRGRGQTMGKGIMKAFVASGHKMKVSVDPLLGKPKTREESSKLSSQIGVVTRDVLPVPKKWKEVDEEKGLDSGFDHIKIHMDVNVDDPGVRKCMIERLKSSTRQKRYKLHQHFKKYATLEEAKNNRPSSINKQNWEVLCEYFAAPGYKDRSVINTGNRKQVRAPHISGRTPFTVLQHEISQKELNGEECDMIELYKRTHYKEKDGWSRVEAQENWELMISKRAQYTEEGIEKSVDEIVLEVLGHGSGYRKGIGYGPKPPSRRTTSHDSSTQQLHNKLQETQEKLQESESQVSGLKSQVGDLKDQLSQQGACIEKLMAFMAASGNTL